MNRKIILISFLATVIVISGCAQEKPISSYDDAGLCILKGQAMGYGNTEIMPKIQAEFARRGELSISKADCDTYIQTGKQSAQVDMQTTRDIIDRSQRSQVINAIQGY
ncbi:hypothetical protein [Citrobacter koseri]|uniref:hypothetical protein n=1 Tax=Citrobacter koseri TaxID=545 RepID=UPI00200387CC|nr:hypothetical protein [Citrobacter koseri]MCK7562528.1 hypothetical protein [Citrobacter koseri]